MAEAEDAAAADTQPLARPPKPGRSARARWTSWPLALVLVWLALAIADIVIITPFSATSRHPAAGAAGAAGPGGGAHRNSAQNGQSHSGIRNASPSASPSPSPRILVPVSASAFGPSGYGSGDNPQNAALAID